MSRQCYIRSRHPKGTTHHKLSFDVKQLNILFPVLKKSVLTFLVQKEFRKKTFDPYTSHHWGNETVHGWKLQFYMCVKNLSLLNFLKISLKSIQRLRRYKCAKLVFQNIKQASTIKKILYYRTTCARSHSQCWPIPYPPRAKPTHSGWFNLPRVTSAHRGEGPSAHNLARNANRNRLALHTTLLAYST